MASKEKEKRVPITEDLASLVMFESDRTCCVCRIQGRKVEIHHLDANPANNSRDNLAVLCKDCHSDAHTTQAFARNLTPGIVRKYNESWLAVVALRVLPGGKAGDELEYAAQILLDIHLAPYAWRNAYIDLYPGGFETQDHRVHTEPWGYLLDEARHDFSAEEWQRYLPLFKVRTPKVIEEMENTVRTYGDALSARMKLQVARCCRSINMEAIGYLYIPQLLREDPSHADNFMYRRFVDTLSALKAVSELADVELKAIRPKPSGVIVLDLLSNDMGQCI
ncbi:HNH endonuclease signature motif containing protein [Acidovorax sp. A1169]|uniref:HNH endonuclease signature motif containing protein n=1 Tax=Acidovorax sp. A1169 TaxID=3059524 RepID=UPI002737CDB8|nr:HNH endonuclease signature motif containing protein [Acidovorax sp. A1169]MDP4078528.1 HNH endonuclease signature motif containing protein [Acidovorax sp. A1169]